MARSIRPLGLPIGSVRALLLLALAARAVTDLLRVHEVTPWLIGAVLIAGSSYFASRQAGPPSEDPGGRGPWWLPTGTFRLVFFVAVLFGMIFWFQKHPATSIETTPLIWIVAAYLIGLLTGMLQRRGYSSREAGRLYFENLLALVSLIAGGALVYFGFQPGAAMQGWIEPFLGAVVVHYFATR